MTGHIGMGLTPGQAKVLAVIKRWFSEQGRAPSIQEIMAETGFTSSGAVRAQLIGLDERGFIRRWAKIARGIELVDQPPRLHFIPVSALTWPVAA